MKFQNNFRTKTFSSDEKIATEDYFSRRMLLGWRDENSLRAANHLREWKLSAELSRELCERKLEILSALTATTCEFLSRWRSHMDLSHTRKSLAARCKDKSKSTTAIPHNYSIITDLESPKIKQTQNLFSRI